VIVATVALQRNGDAVRDRPQVERLADEGAQVRRRSLIWRFMRSRRCWIVCIMSTRMPTPISVTTARPKKVVASARHELKSR
jgi:hypothetical protein